MEKPYKAPDQWATINGQRVPIYNNPPEPEPAPTELISVVLFWFVIVSMCAGIARALLTISDLLAAITVVAFLSLGELNLLYLKSKMGHWNSRQQEVAGLVTVSALFVAAAINLSCFVIELLKIEWLIELERFWFIVVQPLLSSGSMLASLVILKFLDPIQRLQTIQRDAENRRQLIQIQNSVAASTNTADRLRFATETARKFRNEKRRRLNKMIEDGELNQHIDWAAQQAARDMFNLAERGAIEPPTPMLDVQASDNKTGTDSGGVVISTGDGVSHVEVAPTRVQQVTVRADSGIEYSAKTEHTEIVRPQPIEPEPNQKSPKITRDVLAEYTETGMSNAAIGREFGVTGQYVGRLKRRYGLVETEPGPCETVADKNELGVETVEPEQDQPVNDAKNAIFPALSPIFGGGGE